MDGVFIDWSVRLSVTIGSPAKAAELIVMLFRMLTQDDLRKYTFRWGVIPTREGAILRPKKGWLRTCLDMSSG